MRNFKVKDVFRTKRRICVVVELDGFQNLYRTFLEGSQGFGMNYCNGYVQTLTRNHGRDYNDFVNKVDTDELTFSGTLDYFNDSRIPKDVWFFGFDSAHAWNDEHPETKTFASVRERTIQLAEEMMKKGI